MPAIEALCGGVGERRVENQIVASQRPALRLQPIHQRRAEALTAPRFVDDEVVDLEISSVNEILEDAEARQRERPRFRPYRDGAIAAVDLSPPARLEIARRSETRPELPHQFECGVGVACFDGSDRRADAHAAAARVGGKRSATPRRFQWLMTPIVTVR